jgi:hypothetical protein
MLIFSYRSASPRPWTHSNVLQRLGVFVPVLVGTVPIRAHHQAISFGAFAF